ncbi:DUF6660 family protein [Chitinophaga costaii]|uniref:DUF6660 family protein n=1 Tax=Chitinophaga costaii TaxID=1335309 RepID=UPI00293737D6|nr:DUF6660 family protein [Chitinophaga costaii]
MKILGVILSFLVLILSIVPCSDEMMMHTGQAAQVQVSQEMPLHHLPFQDDCSPFCHCACCATFVIIAPVTDHGMRAAQPGKVFNSTYLSLIVAIPRTVWQPPQLS